MRLNVNAKRFKEHLEWAVNSPALMLPDPRKEAFNAVLLQEIDRWLHTHHPKPPQAIRNCARLGIYFEQLWKYIFENCPLFDLVAHNLPVYKHRQTQGAFDFIYYCHNRQHHFHREVAVKFYLSTSGDRHPNGRRDT